MATLLALFFSNKVISIPPEQLFNHKWSEACAVEHDVETAEYTSFSHSQQCDYFVDTFKIQSHCIDASYEDMSSNRVLMTLKKQEQYIIEFLWSSQISILKVISKKPLKLEQTRILGLARVRKKLMTNHLYCP